MVEYGSAVSQGSGAVAGGTHAGNTMDVGASIVNFMNNSAHTVMALPTPVLIAGAIAILFGLLMVRKAF